MAPKTTTKPSKYLRAKRAGDASTSKTVRLPNEMIARFEEAQKLAERLYGDGLETSYTDVMKIAIEEFIAEVNADAKRQGQLDV